MSAKIRDEWEVISEFMTSATNMYRLATRVNNFVRLISLSVISLTGCATSQSVSSDNSVSSDICKVYQAHYLSTDDIQTRFKECYSLKQNCDKAATEFSLIGDIELSKKTWDLQVNNEYVFAQDTTINIGEYELVDYRTLLDTIAKRNKVIMVNEAHHRPECRVLTLEMLAKLKSEGFNYLGLEGLREKTETLVQRGFPTLSSGFFIREPQYANLIRTALKLNYYVFGYDTLGGYRKIRELNQAKEIYKIIQKDSSAKVLIHAGWGHIREDTAIWGGLMGYEFKKLSKIDPFTIQQTRYMPMSAPVFENPLYAKLKHIKQPSVLVKKESGTPYKYASSDLSIFHPNNSMNYFFENNYRKYKFKNKHHEEGFIMVFPIHERIELLPVPSFIQALKHDTKTMLFYLPFSGFYNVYMMDKKSLRHIKKIKVL